MASIVFHYSLVSLDQSSDAFVSERNVFANMELSLNHTTVYGFDFDYTLVQYTEKVLSLIYNITKQRMVERLSVCIETVSTAKLLYSTPQLWSECQKHQC